MKRKNYAQIQEDCENNIICGELCIEFNIVFGVFGDEIVSDTILLPPG